MDYQISNKAKKWTTIAMVIGILFTGIGIIASIGDGLLGRRFMANLLTDSFFFFLLAISALFFLALSYVAEVGWVSYVKRPIEAISGYLPVGMIIFLVTLIVLSFLHGGDIYRWMDPSIMKEGGAHFDAEAAKKGSYLNLTFFWIRTIIFMAAYFIIWKGFMKRSRLQDENPDNALSIHRKNFKFGALFLVVYGYFSSISAWDWLMSIDVHWHSTLYGWYTFAGGWVSVMVVIILLLFYLKKAGYLPKLSESHIQNVGLWIFALSFLWSYLWFAQFMLYWYANIPEEVTYFVMRVDNYKYIFFGMFFINFVFPMLMLMSRDAKRHIGILTFVGLLILIGHWLDTWLMVMGGSMGAAGSFGLMEIGMGVLFLGVFVRIVLHKLSLSPLVSLNDPFLDESIHHEI